MGVQNISDLAAEEHAAHVDASALSQESANEEAAASRKAIAESDAEHVKNDREVFVSRAEVEQKFAEAREEIDAKYQAKVDRAEEQRVEQHAKNLEKRQDALGRVGLNPDGSDPQARPQAVVDRETRRVVEASV